MLQVFVEPREEYNNTIYVDWSLDYCHIERRYSKVKLNDHSKSLYQRAATFETLDSATQSVNVTSKTIVNAIKEEIENMCAYIQK